jgi:hypothetical protein
VAVFFGRLVANLHGVVVLSTDILADLLLKRGELWREMAAVTKRERNISNGKGEKSGYRD